MPHANPVAHRHYQKMWARKRRKENPEGNRKAVAKWKKKNPEKVNAWNRASAIRRILRDLDAMKPQAKATNSRPMYEGKLNVERR